MLQSLRNIWDIPDLRKRVLFTLGMLAVYRLGNHVPTPGINAQALIDFFEQNRGNWFGLVDMFSGGNLARVTIFALGIMPYISASIILQLLTVVWPFLEKLSKEGELGRRKITQYTRYGTVLLSIVQSMAIAAYLEKLTVSRTFRIVEHPGWGFKLMTVLTLTTGTAFIMWLGEQITDRGIGNGMSLLIFAGIVEGFPRGIRPGKRTAEHLDHILGRITFGGAIYLAIIAILPEFLITGFKVAPIPGIGPRLDMFLTDNGLGWITEGLGLNFYFGGTSLLIIVGVAMDTVAQVEAQLIMRHYEGFTGKGGRRIRGRR